MKNKALVPINPYSILAIVLVLIAILSYNRGYDNGFNQANQSYTKCLEDLRDLNKASNELLIEKNKEIDNPNQSLEKCKDKNQVEIIFPNITFNLIVYNFLIICIIVTLYFNLFKGIVKISFGEKIDKMLEQKEDFVNFIKLVIFFILLIYFIIEILPPIINLIEVLLK